MQVFVFENVLQGYSYGMAVIVAESLDRAQRMAWAKFPYWDWDANTFEHWLTLPENEGWLEAAAVYPTTAETEALHYVQGS